MQFVPRRILAACFFSLIPALVSPIPAQTASDVTTAPDAAAQNQEPVTQLDTLVVTARTELPPPENWITTKIPGFTVYSNASERATKRLVRDFETFRFALDNVWPIKATIRHPGTLILCGRGGAFDEFIPRSDKADYSKDAGRASITLLGRDHVYIVVDMGTSTMTLNNVDIDIDTSSLGATFEVDYFSLLYREYVHYLLSQTESPPPPWYEEGVLQIIQKMEVYPKYIRIGELRSVPSGSKQKSNVIMPSVSGDGEDSETAEDDTEIPGMETIPDNDFNVALQRRALLGFKDFFGVKAGSPLARNPIGNNVWAKQCYAFVHMCLYGWPNKYKKPLETFIDRLAREPVTEELFQECFGKTYKKFLVELRGYIGFTAYQFHDFVVKGKERIDSPPREFEPAREGDSAAMKGDALMLAGNPGAALPVLRGAYGRGERDPGFLATYGLVANANNQGELARRMFSQAVTAKTARAAVYPAYAALLLEDAKAHPAASDGVHITPGQLVPILDQLFVARQIRPALPLTYETIANAWLACSMAPKPDNFTVLTEGLLIFPKNMELVYLCARVALKMGDVRAASALIDHGLKKSEDEDLRSRFNDLKSQLEKAAAEKPAAGKAATEVQQSGEVQTKAMRVGASEAKE
jgi:hypothetical protein